MFKKILWATDGSQAADQALGHVTELARGSGASVVVCHSVLTMVGAGAHGAPLALVEEDDIKSKLEAQVSELADGGIQATLELVRGDTFHGAAHDIVRVADAQGADVIVAGTRGHTALGGLLLGSVTQRLLHLAHCPVLVVPPRAAAPRVPAGDGAAHSVA
jgi:nucleotide-binding universal stress UspA family protein